MVEKSKRGRGRPPKPASARKRNNVTIRLRDDTKHALERDAATNQRSLSEEIESRIERSRIDQDYMAQMRQQLGGSASYALLMIIGRVMHEAGSHAAMFKGAKTAADVNAWSGNAYAFDQAARAAITVLNALRPPGDATAPRLGQVPGSLDLDQVAANLGEGFAKTALGAVADPDNAPTADLGQFGRQVRRLLDGAAGGKS